ncbi:MAG: hypothetical protein J3Q66DRAFT_96421 [Benniella sp.]|nr:MAG: hypothetical protein J3Q66DRAFT_96421 [Benniella sp.]
MERRGLTRKHYKRTSSMTPLHHFLPSFTSATTSTPKPIQMSQRATPNTPLLPSQIVPDAEGQSRRGAVCYPDFPELPQSFVLYGPSTTNASAVGVSSSGAGTTAGFGGLSNPNFAHHASSQPVPSFSGTSAPQLNTMASTYDPVQQYAGDQNISATMPSSFNNSGPLQTYDLSNQIATAPTFHGNPHLVAAAPSEDLSEDDLWAMVTIEWLDGFQRSCRYCQA